MGRYKINDAMRESNIGTVFFSFLYICPHAAICELISTFPLVANTPLKSFHTRDKASSKADPPALDNC
jgi:hypothetical protein